MRPDLCYAACVDTECLSGRRAASGPCGCWVIIPVAVRAVAGGVGLSCSSYHIKLCGAALADFCLAQARETCFLTNSLGGVIAMMSRCQEPRPLEFRCRVLHDGAGSFCGQALSPFMVGQNPRRLKPTLTVILRESCGGAANEASIFFARDGPRPGLCAPILVTA